MRADRLSVDQMNWNSNERERERGRKQCEANGSSDTSNKKWLNRQTERERGLSRKINGRKFEEKARGE